MAVKGQLKMRGLKELRMILLSMPAEMVSRNGGPVKQALSEACEPIRELAEKLAPRDKGKLQISLYKFRDRNPKQHGLTERYVIGVRRGKLGKKKREMMTVRGAFGIGFNRTRTVREPQNLKANEAPYGRFVEFGTSKMEAQPFMRPSFDVNHKAAALLLQSSLSRRLTQIAKKLRRQSIKGKRRV